MRLKRGEELPDLAWDMMIRGWIAVDPESGASLSVSHGRTSKAPKYTLIVPKRAPITKREIFVGYEWDASGRKVIRAWTTAEAIAEAERKLSLILRSRASHNDLLSDTEEK